MRASVRLPRLSRQAERTVHLAALALGVWIAVGGAACLSPDRCDFVQFLTLGSLAASTLWLSIWAVRFRPVLRRWLVRVALAGAVTGPLLVIPIVGIEVLQQHAQRLWSLARLLAEIADPALMASQGTYWANLLPTQGSRLSYAVSGGLALVCSAVTWRRSREPLERITIPGLTIALTAPHLYFYDLLILGPAFVRWGAEAVTSRPARLWLTAAYLCPLLGPFVAVTRVQFVTIVLAGWFVATILRPSASVSCTFAGSSGAAGASAGNPSAEIIPPTRCDRAVSGAHH